MIKFWLLVIIIYPLRTLATPVVPQFRSGSSTQSSTSQSVVNEVISSLQYNTGFSYSASGHNIESADVDGYINPSTVVGETQTLGEDGKWTSPRIEVEDKYGTYNTAERTADVPLDILNSYGGDTLEARAKYLSAKERYEKEEADNKNPYKTVSLGLGVTPPIGTDSPRIDNRTIPGKNFDELSVEDHSKLDQTWFFESQIEAELGENWIKQFPLKDQNEIRKFEYRGVFNPATHYIYRGPLRGTVFGIPWEVPGKGWRLVPREKVHNLQSTLTSPDVVTP